jgi:hypothetical protein
MDTPQLWEEDTMTPDVRPSDGALDELSERELAAEAATPLPNREVMSTIRLHPGLGHVAVPINEALALNYESTDSVAFADAEQTVISGPLDAPNTPS